MIFNVITTKCSSALHLHCAAGNHIYTLDLLPDADRARDPWSTCTEIIQQHSRLLWDIPTIRCFQL